MSNGQASVGRGMTRKGRCSGRASVVRKSVGKGRVGKASVRRASVSRATVIESEKP